jgi:hypothetical protein
MAATPRFGIRYPIGTDPANVPAALQNMATDIEARLAALTDATAQKTANLAVWIMPTTGANRVVSLVAGRQVLTYQIINGRLIGDVSFRFAADAPIAGRVVVTLPATLATLGGGTVEDFGTFRVNLQAAAPSTAVYRAQGMLAGNDAHPIGQLSTQTLILQADNGANQVTPIGDPGDFVAGMRLGTDTILNLSLNYRLAS